MAHGLNLVENFSNSIGFGEYENLIAGVGTALLLVVLAAIAGGSLLKKENRLIPDRGFTLRGLFELLAEMLVKLGDMSMGKENRKHLPLVATIFIFLLLSNLIGLIPGMSAPTDSVHFNFGIAVTVFIAFNFYGIREHGFVKYFAHFLGPVHVSWIVWLIAPLILVVELISVFFRPVTLTLRLFGNMTADHGVLQAFTQLTKGTFVPVPVLFYMLGTLVCLVQAFVFTVLTMVYIRLATAHEDGHDEGHEEDSSAIANHDSAGHRA